MKSFNYAIFFYYFLKISFYTEGVIIRKISEIRVRKTITHLFSKFVKNLKTKTS